MNDKKIRNLYFCFTFLLCACSGLAAAPLIGKLNLAFFLGLCAMGIIFSSKAGPGVKKNLRNFFGLSLLVGLPLFFWKVSLQQSALPDLIRIFIILIIASCFIIENSLTLSLVHFECIFITIFSACLPFIIHPRYQVALFGFGLFLIIVLLQITQIKMSDDQASQYVISNVSIARRFVMSFIISLLITGIGSLVFFMVPKYSFQLDLNMQGSSLVDFRLKPQSNLRLMMPYKGGEKELNQNEIVSYVRSLFVESDGDEKLMFFEDSKWKNPLILKEKKKDEIIKDLEQGNNKKGLVSSGDDISQEDEDGIVNQALAVPLSRIKTKIKDLEEKIAKQKKLYDLMSFLGKDDPEKAGKAKEISVQIKKDLKELAKLGKDLVKEQRQTADKHDSEKQGSGDIGLLAKLSGFGKNFEQEKDNNQGDDLGQQDSGKGQEGSGEGTGLGEEGLDSDTGEGQSGSESGESGKGDGQQSLYKDAQGYSQGEPGDIAGEKGTEDEKQSLGQEEQGFGLGEPGDMQGQKQGNQAQKADNDSGLKGDITGDSDGSSSGDKSNINPGQKPSANANKSDINDESFSSKKNNAEQGSKSDKAQPNDKLERDKGNDQEKSKSGEGSSKGSGGVGGKATGDESFGSGSSGNKSGVKGAKKGKSGSGSGGGNSKGSGGLMGKGQSTESGSGGDGTSGGKAGSGGSAGGMAGQGTESGSGGDGSGGQGEGDGSTGKNMGGSGLEGVDQGKKPPSSSSNEDSSAKSAENKPRSPTANLIIKYLFKFEDKPLSSFRDQAAIIARGSLPKKIKSENKSTQNLSVKDNLKTKNKAEQKKAEVPIPVLPEPLAEEQTNLGSAKNFFWHLFIFFAVLFCGGICWALLYVLFCLFRKILRDLKLRYLLIFKLDRIITYLYRNVLFVFKKIGLKSYEFLTPKEIGRIAVKKFNLSEQAVQSLTREFEKSRYSNHKITKKNISTCINAYNQLKIDIIKNNNFLGKIMLKLNMLSIKKRRNHDL